METVLYDFFSLLKQYIIGNIDAVPFRDAFINAWIDRNAMPLIPDQIADILHSIHSDCDAFYTDDELDRARERYMLDELGFRNAIIIEYQALISETLKYYNNREIPQLLKEFLEPGNSPLGQ